MAKKSRQQLLSKNQKIVDKRIDEVFDKHIANLSGYLATLAQDVIEYIDSQKAIPIYTGNLRDATGIGVYTNGKLTRYVPSQIATRPQSSGFNYTNIYNIWGYQYLSDALEAASKEYSKGVWFVLFSAVPYAFYIEDRYNYFSDLKDIIYESIISNLKTI